MFNFFKDFCSDLNPGYVGTSWAYTGSPLGGSAVTSGSLKTTKYNAKDVSRGQISVWSVSGDDSRGSEGSRSRQGLDWVLSQKKSIISRIPDHHKKMDLYVVGNVSRAYERPGGPR